MDRKRWHEIERLLLAAFDLGEDERENFLDEECGDDLDLRRQVKSLLEAEQRAPAFLDSDIVAFAGPAIGDEIGDRAPSPAEPGQRLGAYRIIREIGHGGMSVVYLAERADGEFDRKVAVKLLRHLGGEPDERALRFRTERQILATLEHAHIARVYGGGVTDGGWPYLAMELVEGVPITDYCQSADFPLDARLDLFDDVCDAVEHAHQRLVVHRDLKPGNILVSKEGDVKLLDFGIAKLLDDRSGSARGVPMTAAGVRALTPQYAAPEQIRGETISTATDVYALGLLLYELLAESQPYHVRGSATEIERIVCEQEVVRPSSKSTDRMGVEGDLDTIVLMALRKDPAHRYGSVRELRDDLRRYRSGLPVRARPLTAGYRLQKYVRRNRLGVALGALIAFMLVAFTVVTIRQQQATELQRDQARLEAQRASEVTDFLLSLFEANDPTRSLGETPSAVELLERGIQRARRLQSQPAVRAEMLTVIGRAYRGLGRYTDADTTMLLALEAQTAAEGSDDVDIAAAIDELANVKTDLAEYASADSLFRVALGLTAGGGVARDSIRAVIYNDYAILKQHQADLTTAESLHTAALNLRRGLAGGREGVAVAQSLHNLAETRHQLGHYQVADSLYLAALAIQRQELPDLHPSIAATTSALAANRNLLGDFESADSLYRIALDAQRDVLGPDHPTAASTAMQLANLLAGQAYYDEAESLHLEVLASRQRALGADHPDVGESLFSLAYVASLKGDYDESERLYREAVDLWIPTLGEGHPYVTLAYNNLAVVLSNQGRTAEYVEINRDVLRRHLEKFGPESPHVAISLGNLGDGLVEMGEFEEAEIQLTRALELRTQLFGKMDSRTADAYSLLSKLNRRKGRFSEAEPLERTAFDIRRKVLGERHPRVAYSLDGLAHIAWRLGREDEAASLFEEGIEIRIESLGPDHPLTTELLRNYAKFSEATGRQSQAGDFRSRIEASSVESP